jgi:hypothetical protein
VTAYSCSTSDYAGAEYAHRFVAAESEPVTVTLTGMSVDMDLLILEGTDCDPLECIASSETRGTDDESVTFPAEAGRTYAVVVDGHEGARGSYEITLACTPSDAPDLSLGGSIDLIPGQPPDFNTTGASAGVFDIYVGQEVTVQFTFRNAGTAATATGVVAGLATSLSHLDLARWDLLTDSGTCGEEWCPDPTADLPGQPPRVDPGSEIDVILGDIEPGTARRIVAVASGVGAVDPGNHAWVHTWIGHVDGVYDKEDFETPASLNVGQTWNDGDLRMAADLDVWSTDGPGDGPPDDGPPGDGDDRWETSSGCGCSIVR